MTTIYLNWKGPEGRETVDQVDLDPEHFPKPADVRKEARRLVEEYTLAGMAVYQSSRPCKGWNTE